MRIGGDLLALVRAFARLELDLVPPLRCLRAQMSCFSVRTWWQAVKLRLLLF